MDAPPPFRAGEEVLVTSGPLRDHVGWFQKVADRERVVILMNLLGRQMPFWVETLAMSQTVAAAVGLGYLGVDIVIDAELGPMLLEANARPGLAIQIANGEGLMQVLARIDAQSAAISTSSADRSVCRFGEC
jgi:hypothetical protein